jgi:hypothetical protein
MLFWINFRAIQMHSMPTKIMIVSVTTGVSGVSSRGTIVEVMEPMSLPSSLKEREREKRDIRKMDAERSTLHGCPLCYATLDTPLTGPLYW